MPTQHGPEYYGLLHTRLQKSALNSWQVLRVVVCLGHCSIAVRRHHDQGRTYERKHLVGGLAGSSRDLVHYHDGREHGGMEHGGEEVESYILTCEQRERTGLSMGF